MKKQEIERWEQMPHLLKRFPNKKQQQFFTLLYLTGARVGEIYRQEEGEPLGIRGKDLYYRNVEGKKFVFVHINTEKNRREKHRIVPILYEREKKLIQTIESIPGAFEQTNYDLLFYDSQVKYKTVHKRWQTQCNKAIGKNPHWFRHCRVSHCILNFKMRNYENIRKMFGWTDYRPMSIYSHFMVEDIAQELAEHGGYQK